MEKIIWFLPLLFIFHDLEELIFMRLWVNRNKAFLERRYPVVAKRMIQSTGNLSTEGFAMAVAVLFILLSSVTLYSYIFRNYLPWIALFMIFFLHLFIHIAQAIIIRKYTPALITSLLAIFPCSYIFITCYHTFSASQLIVSTLIGLAIALPVFAAVIKLAGMFDQWLHRKYS